MLRISRTVTTENVRISKINLDISSSQVDIRLVVEELDPQGNVLATKSKEFLNAGAALAGVLDLKALKTRAYAAVKDLYGSGTIEEDV